MRPSSGPGAWPMTHPDPVLPDFHLWAVVPYFLEGTDNRDRKALLERIRDMKSSPGRGWILQAPSEDPHASELLRWFYHEVRSLFVQEEGAGQGPLPEEGPISPKFRWLEPKPEEGPRGELPPGIPDLSAWKTGVLDRAGHLRPLRHLAFEKVRVLLSNAGVVMVVLSFKGKDLPLSDAMLASYVLAHGDASDQALVLVPHATISEAQKRRHEAAVAAGTRVDGNAPLPMTETELARMVHLGTTEGNPRRSKETAVPGASLPRMIRDDLARMLDASRTLLATHGRVPVVTHYLLPWPEGTDIEGPAADALRKSYEPLEVLAARCLRHPDDARILPLPLETIQCEEFQTIPVTGSQRFHVTCEAMTAFGYACTPFDQTNWCHRVASEYLLTFLLALHQAVACQDLSWRSYTRKDGQRDNEALVSAFLEYTTEYDFGLVSPQFNIQRLYRASRTALGVERIEEDVRRELDAWIENEQRVEQGTLNSLALLAVLASIATIFLGLGLSPFSNDAKITLFTAEGDKVPGLLFFWLPLAVVTVVVAVKRSLRRHVVRVWELFWRGRP
jgi:hypothetical protein